jgi:aminoglycoside phosphotransferase (APT) family kinase protein
MISSAHMARYLVANGLIDVDHVVAGRVTLSLAGGRNYSFIVGGERPLLVKQATWLEESREGLDREIRFYRQLLPTTAAPLADRIPNLIFADEAAGVLALELIANAAPLFQIWQAQPAHPRALDAARRIGAFLAELHGVPNAGELPAEAPWAFAAHQPTRHEFRLMSGGAADCLRILQQNQVLCDHMEAARAAWRGDALIHADIKSDNLLFDADGLHVVDWESIQRGDGAWDIAGFFQDVILYWLFSIPVSPVGFDVDRLGAQCPLTNLGPVLAAFLGAYEARTPAEPLAALVPRAAALTAIRLVQFALEYAHQRNAVTPQSLMALRVAESITRLPDWVAMVMRGEHAAIGELGA